MGYTVQNIEPCEAYGRIQEYEYALLYMMSELILCKTSEIQQVDWKECLEARFFSGDRELHIYEEDGSHMAVEIRDLDKDNIVTKRYCLANKFKGIGKRICVQEYLDYDEDGQAFVCLTRLSGIE